MKNKKKKRRLSSSAKAVPSAQKNFFQKVSHSDHDPRIKRSPPASNEKSPRLRGFLTPVGATFRDNY